MRSVKRLVKNCVPYPYLINGNILHRLLKTTCGKNTFFLSLFSYRPSWMCYSRIKNDKTNGLHGRFLQLIYIMTNDFHFMNY